MSKNTAGKRTHRADVLEHLGIRDADGWPKDGAGEYKTLISGLPCAVESLTTNDEKHSHNLYCEYAGGASITSANHIVINNNTYEVLSVDDPEGTFRELIVKLRKIDVPEPFHSDLGT